MRLRRSIAAVILLSGLVGPQATAAPEDSSGGEPWQPTSAIVTSTRQNAFTIPFRIEPPEKPDQKPIEVQLHVSTNQGATWEVASRVKPEKGSFVFRAPHDGEYWYSIRTVDKQGVVRPEGPPSAQLKVTVDTVAPRLDFTAARGQSGEIVARWQAVDPNLKLSSFKLEYQPQGGATWERVAVNAPPSAMRHTLSGEATWLPRPATGTIVVRAEITDQAGNPAVSQAVVKLSDASAPADTAGRRDPAGPPRNTLHSLTSLGTGDPSAPTVDRGSGSSMPSDVDGGRQNASPASRDADWRPANPTDGGHRGAQRVPAQPVVQSLRTTQPGSALDFALLPEGQRPRMINMRSFELEYEIEAIGPSGIGKVELWGTRDGGRTWSVYGVNNDNRSPMPVSVDSEGIFGFRIVVQSGNGLGGRPPVEGDLPDVWIGVDLTKPTCRITSATVDVNTSELEIRWNASDDALERAPCRCRLA